MVSIHYAAENGPQNSSKIIQTCLNDLFYFLNLISLNLNQKYDEQKYSAFCNRVHLNFE